MEARRQALRLRYWGDRHDTRAHSPLADSSYEAIQALRQKAPGLFELRLDGQIGGHVNVRVIFLVPPADWTPNEPEPLPTLWLIEFMSKKRDDFTTHDLNRFCAGRSHVQEYFYSG